MTIAMKKLQNSRYDLLCNMPSGHVIFTVFRYPLMRSPDERG